MNSCFNSQLINWIFDVFFPFPQTLCKFTAMLQHNRPHRHRFWNVPRVLPVHFYFQLETNWKLFCGEKKPQKPSEASNTSKRDSLIKKKAIQSPRSVQAALPWRTPCLRAGRRSACAPAGERPLRTSPALPAPPTAPPAGPQSWGLAPVTREHTRLQTASPGLGP